MPTLRDLEATFVRFERRTPEPPYTGSVIIHVATIGEAQGVMFLCPLCFAKNGGPVGTHQVLCWSRSRGIADDVEPKPGRWTLDGSSIDDLTLNGDPPGAARSVLLTGDGCAWHGFVTNGEAA